MSATVEPVYVQRHPFWTTVTNRVAPFVVLVYQLLALVALGTIVIKAFTFNQTPFIGSFVEHTLVLNASESVRPGTWHAKAQDLDYGNQIQAIDGAAVESVDEFNRILGTYAVGDEVTLTLKDLTAPGQPEYTAQIELQAFPRYDLVSQMLIPFLIGMIYLGTGLWVLNLRRYDVTGQVFSTFTASAAIAASGLFEINTTGQLTGLWTFSLAMAGGGLIHLGLIFPKSLGWIRRRPFLGWLSYIPTALLVFWAYPLLFNFADPLAYVRPWRFEYVFLAVSILFFVSMGIYHRLTANTPITRQQSQIVLLGSVFSFTPLASWLIITAGNPDINFSPYLLFPLAIFPVAIAYAILRYRLLNTDYVFSRAVLYALLTILTVGGYAFLVSGLTMVFGDALGANNPFVIGFMVFVLAMLLNPLRNWLQTWIDRIFFRGQHIYQERIEAFSQELTPAMDYAAILGLLRSNIADLLKPEQLHIFVLDSTKDNYSAAGGEAGKPTTDLYFSKQSALTQVLSRQEPIFIPEGGRIPDELISDRARINLLGSQVFIPMQGRDESVIGFMALSPRQTGEPYTARDLELLESLSDQAAVAVERAQVVADLERRVTEMNVLIRVAQGINITLRFDDILELIYAQTNRLIPTEDFWIMLYDPANKIYQYAFFLEDDRRLLQYENQYIFAVQDLTQLVIRDGRHIVTENYVREARLNGLSPLVEGVFAWIGVPLNAGATTIGALSLGSRDSSVIYSADHVALLQAVADQAAGAIVKARLLEDSERSARQLSLLNDVGRNLTSVLDLPNLLEQILDSAMEILNTDAGTLFLVDDDTGELVFEVVKGPVAEELIGQRLPPGTGHVGRSVDTGQPSIVNEVRSTTEWSQVPDEQTGFKTRDLLLVPMMVKDRVVGVIEVINRRDGMPFTEEDQELLATFTSQAAVALENARLYTLTDQQLAERVDELSVMQRIDRELNASLDVTRSMRITLEWAMRQSMADAGFVGIVEEEGVRVTAAQGYFDELKPYPDLRLPMELPGLKGAIQDVSTQKFRRSDFAGQQADFGLLEGAMGQLVIPIRREASVIGVLMLETRGEDQWTEDTQAFLSRLTDHAAIAIANAQLFAQVQAADIAKSDFVSFVAHELKTPMTSIRGYTDLLIGGAVGPVNDAQENFLGTIRANVTRMATLVSDLADVSRIEAGRLHLDFQAVDVADFVDEVIRSQRQSFEEKQQVFRAETPENLSPVWGDRTRLVQVLVNLASNAYKYTPDGGEIVIEAEQTENHWDPDGAPEVVRIAVRDNGLGMKPEDQEKIFTKFFRSDDPEARQSPGTGLGLNITRYLVEMQGGKIWFESEYGKGTTFHFTVPVAEV